jgi:hypothetical protein
MMAGIRQRGRWSLGGPSRESHDNPLHCLATSFHRAILSCAHVSGMKLIGIEMAAPIR